MTVNKIYLIFMLMVTACGNNYLYLEGKDEDTQNALEQITQDVNSLVGCNVWSVKADNIKRRSITVEHSNKIKEYNSKAYGIFNEETNEIYYVLNPDNFFFSKIVSFTFPLHADSIKYVLLHELGHAMGLEHESNTVMSEGAWMAYSKALPSLIELLNKHNLIPCKN